MKKKVLIVCKGHQNIAGAQLYLKQISTLFPRHEYEIHFAFSRKDGTRVFDEISRECTVYQWEYDWRHLSAIASFIKGFEIFRKIRPDLVIFNGSEDKILYPVWAACLGGAGRRVMVIHWAQSANGLPAFRKKPGHTLPRPSFYSIKTRLLRGLSLCTLNRIVFVNNGTRKAYVKLYKIPAKRCSTIYNGIEPEAFSSMKSRREEFRRMLGVRDDECMALATGNLTEVKGYKYLISAVADLVNKGVAIKCFIAGQGELKDSLDRQIEEMRLEDSVKLLGYRDDVPALLGAADIFCMPSLSEALGYSLLEALAAGVPVVASRVGGIPEVITHGKEGFLVPAKNVSELCMAIQQLVSNPELRKKMSSQALATVSGRFSVGKMLSESGDLFFNELQHSR